MDKNLELFNLQDNEKLSTLSFKDEADWLELRNKGIGGSDIGAIMGINPYRSPLQVYKEKIEGIKVDLSNNVNVKKGKELEDVILTRYVKPLLAAEGYVVGKPDFMIVNSDYPFFRANVDGIAFKPGSHYADNLIIEIKCISEHGEEAWNKTDYCGVPPYYYGQVQEYMLVTGARNTKVCALFEKSWTMHYFDVPRDEAFMAKMITSGKGFYDLNMVMRVPPMPRVNIDKEEVINVIEHSTEPANPSPEMTELVKRYLLMDEKVKKAGKYMDDLKSQILDLYNKGNKPDDTTLHVKCSVVTSTRLDSTKLKKENPGIYQQYAIETKSSRFTIK